MMPPHTTSITPRNKSLLTSNMIVVRGYSLQYADDPVMINTTTGQKLSIVFEVKVSLEGDLSQKSPLPGSIQEVSSVLIKIPELIPGHVYQLEYADELFEWKAAEKF